MAAIRSPTLREVLSDFFGNSVSNKLSADPNLGKTAGEIAGGAPGTYLEHPSLKLMHIHRGRGSFGIPAERSRR
jgi:hypothetical protein